MTSSICAECGCPKHSPAGVCFPCTTQARWHGNEQHGTHFFLGNQLLAVCDKASRPVGDEGWRRFLDPEGSDFPVCPRCMALVIEAARVREAKSKENQNAHSSSASEEENLGLFDPPRGSWDSTFPDLEEQEEILEAQLHDRTTPNKVDMPKPLGVSEVPGGPVTLHIPNTYSFDWNWEATLRAKTQELEEAKATIRAHEASIDLLRELVDQWKLEAERAKEERDEAKEELRRQSRHVEHEAEVARHQASIYRGERDELRQAMKRLVDHAAEIGNHSSEMIRLLRIEETPKNPKKYVPR